MKRSLVPPKLRTRLSSVDAVDGKRKSNIPIKKAVTGSNAPTRASILQPNKSYRKSSSVFSMGRVSVTAGESKRDTRATHDKNYQQKCILQLLDFIDKYSPHLVTAKALQSPSNKDFLQVFQMLYKFVDSSFNPTQGVKLEDEIPRLLKEIKYPILIPRSHLMSVGAPRSWPIFLAALDWLRTYVLLGLSVESNPIVMDLEASRERQLYMQFHYKTYDTFLSGSDDFSCHFNNLRSEISKKSDTDKTETENQELELKIQSLQSQLDQFPNLDRDLQLFASDEEKFDLYLAELKNHIENKKQRNESVGDMIEKEEESLKLTNEDTEKKKKIAKVQEINYSMYDDLQKKHEAQINRKFQIENEIKQICEANGLDEIKLSKNKDEINSLCTSYNNLCRKIRLIPATEPFAQNQDFELLFTFGIEASGRVDEIKYIIINRTKKIKDENHDLAKEFIDSENYIARMADLIADGEREVQVTEQKIKIDKEIEDAKAANLRVIQLKEIEINELEGKLRGLRKPYDHMEFSAVQKENEALRKVKDAENTKQMKRADKLYNNALEMHDSFEKYMTEILKKHWTVIKKAKRVLL